MTSYNNSPSNVDFNVSNYTISQLMTILDLRELDEEEIKLKTNYYINRYGNSATRNPQNIQLAIFFKNIQIALLASLKHNPENNTLIDMMKKKKTKKMIMFLQIIMDFRNHNLKSKKDLRHWKMKTFKRKLCGRMNILRNRIMFKMTK
jgi:hypothetical protein